VLQHHQLGVGCDPGGGEVGAPTRRARTQAVRAAKTPFVLWITDRHAGKELRTIILKIIRIGPIKGNIKTLSHNFLNKFLPC